MPSPVIHFELPADDMHRAEAFYRQAFGWNAMSLPEMGYTLLGTATATDENGQPTKPAEINGGMFARTDELTHPLVTIAVDDIDDALRTVESCGGKTLVGRQQVADMGFTGYFADTEGNVVGLWQNA